jgi:hypothetical protein
MKKSVLCILGAGFSISAGIPLAKDLFRSDYVLAMSEGSRRRFDAVLQRYQRWQQHNPNDHAEQFLGELYQEHLRSINPQWNWAVEYMSAVIASAGTPPQSRNRNPRYSNRISNPIASSVYRSFWKAVVTRSDDVSVLTTNYDILIERGLRHKPMKRPVSPGGFYGGLPRPQWLKGAAQPFSVFSPERLIEMTGGIPIYKLHGSLSWSLNGETLLTYQDLRSAFRNGGDAAIIPPIPEKALPRWLRAVWQEAELVLRRSDVWVICGYSAPPYDIAVRKMLKDGSAGRRLRILLLSPDSNLLRMSLNDLIPKADIIPLPGLPEGIEALADSLDHAL